jgi:hypothetical protein
VGHATAADADLILVGASDDAVAYRLSQNDPRSNVYDPIVSPFPSGTGGTVGFEDYQGCRIGSSFPRCFYSVIEVRFSVPTDLIQMTSQFFTDTPRLIAYDVFDNPIASFLANGGVQTPQGAFTMIYTHLPGLGFSTQLELTLALPSRQIARVVYGGDNQVLVTRVAYQVPEPSTIGLMVLGLVTTGLIRRRTSRASRSPQLPRRDRMNASCADAAS